METTTCWNTGCIAGDCDGENHLDFTGHTWTQKRGQEFNPATGRYEFLHVCQWFALCDHPATGTMTHPVLGEVHICDRCRTKVEALQS